MITIILEYEKAEEEYISSNLSYAALAQKHNIPLRLLARYAKENKWVEKRKKYNASPDSCFIDISKLTTASDALESIIENAFTDLCGSSSDKKEVDTKTLKDLTSALKEAINIKQNIFLLPLLTEQKQYEFEQKKIPFVDPSDNEIRVILENDTDKYSM